MADDLHQVLRADAVDPLLQWGTRRGVRASKECGRDYRSRKSLLPGLSCILGPPQASVTSPFHSYKDATLLQTQHQTLELPIALEDTQLAYGSSGVS